MGRGTASTDVLGARRIPLIAGAAPGEGGEPQGATGGGLDGQQGVAPAEGRDGGKVALRRDLSARRGRTEELGATGMCLWDADRTKPL